MDDWRDLLPPYARQRLVRKIIEVSRYHPVLDEEGLLELQKIAERLEEKAYATATTVSDYERIIDLKLNSVEKEVIEGVYQKIQTMKEAYLPELNEMYQKLATKLQQLDSLSQQPQTDRVGKLKIFHAMLQRIITFLEISKSQVLSSFSTKLVPNEKQIINFLSKNRPTEAMTLQQAPLPNLIHSSLNPKFIPKTTWPTLSLRHQTELETATNLLFQLSMMEISKMEAEPFL